MARSSPDSPDFQTRPVVRGNRRRPARTSFWQRARALLADSLREQPVFDLDNAPSEGAPSSVVEAAKLDESQRETIYQEQWLRVFLVRLRLTAVIGSSSLWAFVGFYFLLFPEINRLIFLVTAIVTAGLCAQFALTFRVSALYQVRLLTLFGFFFFSLTMVGGLSLVFAPPGSFGSEAARAVQFIIVFSFAHTLILTLLVPLRLGDTLAISALVLGALKLGLVSVPAGMNRIPPVGALWSVSTFALFVTLLSHFNSRLRRRAFDATFDLALQALELKAMSETDALTSGFNRRHSERVLASELLRSARFARPLSVLMFDLDNFKPVNDTLGHGAGDLVLIAVYQAAHAELREVDDLARIGGDEFLIILPETEQKQTQRIARRLRVRVARELELRFGKQSLLSKVTISVGALTIDSSDGLEAKTVFERVDELLYRAKKAGKNRVVMGLASDERADFG